MLIANEFAVVEVEEDRSANGPRLKIHSPSRGLTIFLDPLQLESLTWQEPNVFASFLRTPFGGDFA